MKMESDLSYVRSFFMLQNDLSTKALQNDLAGNVQIKCSGRGAASRLRVATEGWRPDRARQLGFYAVESRVVQRNRTPMKMESDLSYTRSLFKLQNGLFL